MLIATAVPAAANSVDPQTPATTLSVIAVRHTGPAWAGTGSSAPGFRFGLAGVAAGADLIITKQSGPVATFSQVFTTYQGYATWSQNSAYVGSTIPLTSAATVGVTVNQVDAAVGRYQAIIAPHGGGAQASATFEIYKDGSLFRVRP